VGSGQLAGYGRGNSAEDMLAGKREKSLLPALYFLDSIFVLTEVEIYYRMRISTRVTMGYIGFDRNNP
jgi:hypothetical protein